MKSTLNLLPRSVTDQHKRLTEELLPKALDVMSDTMGLNPWEEVTDKDGNTVFDPASGLPKMKFNTRLNGQRIRAAQTVVVVVERLGDQALKRQAGRKLNAILAEIRRAKSAKLVESKPEDPAPLPAPVQDPPEGP